VFISALRRLRDTERPIMFKPWIFEIAKNACIDEFRRARRNREVSLDGEDSSDTLASRSPASAPEAAMENKQRLDDLRGAFNGLSESHHRMIVMRELEGLSYVEIGERLGMEKPLVQSSLFRARRRLSQEYEELVSGRRCQHVQGVIATDGERPLLSLGVRERRQLARHLAHCQPCRRVARLAAVDESFFRAPGLAGKVAALLPLGWLRLRRGGVMRSSGAHAGSVLPPFQTFGPMLDPSGVGSGLGRIAAAVAALAVAGAGGGVVVNLGGHGPSRQAQPRISQIAPASAASNAVASAVSSVAAAAPRADGLRTWATGAGAAVRDRTHKQAGHRRAAAGGGAGSAGAGTHSSTGTSTGATGASAAAPPASSTGSGSTGGSASSGTGGLAPKLPTVSVPLPAPPPAVQNPLNLLQNPPLPPLNLTLPKVPQPTLLVSKLGSIVASLGHSKSPG
jgi:RNA polymerase sigma factor (sigma-70 family)